MFTSRRLPPLLCSLVAVFLLGLPARSAAQAPKIGDVQRLQVASVSLNVGWTEKEARRVTYTPPPGWYIRSHRVECKERYGLASYAVSTVPAGWDASGEDARAESAQERNVGTLRAPGVGGQAKAAVKVERTAADNHRRTNSHHALVVEATAQGAGYFRGGGGLELSVTAELVYLGMAAGEQTKDGRPAAR
jgi:hypothetical protein